jgi:hypothetical protein
VVASDEVYFGGIQGEIVGARQTEHTASGLAGEPHVFAGMLKERIRGKSGKGRGVRYWYTATWPHCDDLGFLGRSFIAIIMV